MKDLNYPTGWKGKAETQDELTNCLLLIVSYAGKTISYKDAIKQIEEIMKSNLKEDKKTL